MTAHTGKDVEQGELSSITGVSENLHNHCGNQYGISLENWESTYLKTQVHQSLGHIHKGYCVLPQGHFLNYAHFSFIHNSQKLETT